MGFIFRLIFIGLMAYGAWQLWQKYDFQTWYQECRDAKVRVRSCLKLPAARVNPKITPTFYIKDKCIFEPREIEINAGQTIAWENTDSQPQQIISNSFETYLIDSGKTFSKKFNEPGTISFICADSADQGFIIIK